MEGEQRAFLPSTGTGESFWDHNQPGFRFAVHEPGTSAFFGDVEAARYALEPHIPEVVGFEGWRAKDVLEVGCGIGTDGFRFARGGARYTGLDLSAEALELAQRRFALESLEGDFVHGSLTDLPFAAGSFDLVYSHGVVHHIPDTERAIVEFARVLRPGGVALVMVYHRSSLNYWLTIMGVRRVLAAFLLVPGAVDLIARVTGEPREVLEGHRRLLRTHGTRYLTDRALFLSNNTDGPGNPLSKAYTRREAMDLFAGFADVQTAVRHLNLRIYPGGSALARTAGARLLERRFGWHLYVRATKGTR